MSKDLDFWVRKGDVLTTKWAAATTSGTLGERQALMEVETFALTSNVLGYAMSGSSMKYYSFFPTVPTEADQDAAKHGRVPTWGIARCVASNVPDVVPVGSRYYGLVPISRRFLVEPKAQPTGGFTDLAPHRQGRAPIYNMYTPCTEADPLYVGPDARREALMILYRPLFLTAFLLREAVNELGCDGLVVTSSSSKTGTSLGKLVRQHGGVRAFGLTSRSNAAYMRSTKSFDEIFSYDEIDALISEVSKKCKRVAVVDLYGEVQTIKRLQEGLQPGLLSIMVVGSTNVEKSDFRTLLSGDGFNKSVQAQPTFFFAPEYAARMIERLEGGQLEFGMKVREEFLRYVDDAKEPVIQTAVGPESVERVYRGFAKGSIHGSEHWVGTLSQEASSKL